MASVQEVIASFDLEKIKGRRAACKRMLSILKKQLETKLAKTGADPEEFDHASIPRKKVQDDFSKVKKYHQDFEEPHYALLSCRPEDEDAEEERKLAEKDDTYYEEVIAVAQELLELSDQYEASYQLFADSKPDPDKDKLKAESKASTALATQEEETKKQGHIVLKERLFDRAWAVYSTHKKEAAEMVKHADGFEFAAIHS